MKHFYALTLERNIKYPLLYCIALYLYIYLNTIETCLYNCIIIPIKEHNLYVNLRGRNNIFRIKIYI